MTATALRKGDVDRLIAEIERYLAAVDAFRGEGCHITWEPSLPAGPERRKTQ